MIIHRGNDFIKFKEKKKKEIIAATGSKTIKERDFVPEIREHFFESDIDKILVVSGLRATGKTTGLLQAVKNHCNVLYIEASQEKKTTAEDCIKILDDAPERFIIIDEYSWIQDRRRLDQRLCELMAEGKRIAVTGTDSIALDYLSKGGMPHRALYKNVNLFTYQEFCRIYNRAYDKKSADDFIKMGGIFLDYAIETFDDMKTYINDAVISNYKNYLGISEEKAKAIIYDIMYLAVCPSDANRVFYPNSRKNDIQYQRMLSALNIDPFVEFDAFDLKRASDILEKTGFIVKTHDIFHPEEFRLNLVNPSLTYQMTFAVFGDLPANRRMGMAFEAYTVSYLSSLLHDTDKLYYLNLGAGHPELEIVVFSGENHCVYLMDAKEQDDCRLPDNKSLVAQSVVDAFDGVTVNGRYVICNAEYEKASIHNGKPVVFTCLESDILSSYDEFDRHFQELSQEGKRFRTKKEEKKSKKIEITKK